jgi:hypothetical protein
MMNFPIFSALKGRIFISLGFQPQASEGWRGLSDLGLKPQANEYPPLQGGSPSPPT